MWRQNPKGLLSPNVVDRRSEMTTAGSKQGEKGQWSEKLARPIYTLNECEWDFCFASGRKAYDEIQTLGLFS